MADVIGIAGQVIEVIQALHGVYKRVKGIHKEIDDAMEACMNMEKNVLSLKKLFSKETTTNFPEQVGEITGKFKSLHHSIKVLRRLFKQYHRISKKWWGRACWAYAKPRAHILDILSDFVGYREVFSFTLLILAEGHNQAQALGLQDQARKMQDQAHRLKESSERARKLHEDREKKEKMELKKTLKAMDERNRKDADRLNKMIQQLIEKGEATPENRSKVVERWLMSDKGMGKEEAKSCASAALREGKLPTSTTETMPWAEKTQKESSSPINQKNTTPKIDGNKQSSTQARRSVLAPSNQQVSTPTAQKPKAKETRVVSLPTTQEVPIATAQKPKVKEERSAPAPTSLQSNLKDPKIKETRVAPLPTSLRTDLKESKTKEKRFVPLSTTSRADSKYLEVKETRVAPMPTSSQSKTNKADKKESRVAPLPTNRLIEPGLGAWYPASTIKKQKETKEPRVVPKPSTSRLPAIIVQEPTFTNHSLKVNNRPRSSSPSPSTTSHIATASHVQRANSTKEISTKRSLSPSSSLVSDKAGVNQVRHKSFDSSKNKYFSDKIGSGNSHVAKLSAENLALHGASQVTLDSYINKSKLSKENLMLHESTLDLAKRNKIEAGMRHVKEGEKRGRSYDERHRRHSHGLSPMLEAEQERVDRASEQVRARSEVAVMDRKREDE